MKNEVRKVDYLTEEVAQTYNLTKKEALDRLKSTGVSESDQMLTKWCRDEVIDAVRISRGAPSNRGLRVSGKSLEAFILIKGGKSQELLKQIAELEAKLLKKNEENKDLKQQIKEFKENGVVVESKKGIKIEDFEFTSIDNLEATFKYERATYSCLFAADTNELIQLKKRGRGRSLNDITDKMKPEFKQAIEEMRNNLLSNGS